MQILAALVAGLVFGCGIAVAGMINPAKVLNFFDIAGTWDPSLAFVMGGALLVAAAGYAVVLRRERPRLDSRFHLPTRRDLDPALIGGSVLFGIGWGIAGFCPGGAIPALGLGRAEPVWFVLAMVAGQMLARWLRAPRATGAPPAGADGSGAR